MKIRALPAAIGGTVAGLALGMTVAPAVADVNVINDVRTGVYQLFDEAANRSTPTGRQFDDDVSLIIRQQVNEAVNCGAAEGHPSFVNDADCDGEGVEVP